MIDFEWIDVRDALPVKPYFDEYMVCIKGADISTVLSFEDGVFFDPKTNEVYDVEYWHPCIAPPKQAGMIAVGEYRAFFGRMKIDGVGTLEGDWIYKPDLRCWVGRIGSFPAEICTVEEVFGCRTR